MVVAPVNIPCVRLLPLDFSNCVTDYEMLCKLLKGVNEAIVQINANADNIKQNSEDIVWLTNMVNYLNGEIDKIANGEYMDIYIEALAKWIDKNLQEIVARIAKQVFFGLGGPNDAYFVAYIPESWSDIQFDTIMECGSPYWGHLVLKY